MTPSTTSRRAFLATMAATTATIALSPQDLLAATDPRVAHIIASTIGVDMHSHVQIRFTANAAAQKPDPAIDVASEIRRSGFSAVCQTWGVDGLATTQPGGYYDHYQRAMAFEDHLLATNNMRRALSMKDLQTAHDRRQPIIVQSTEGAQFLEGKLARIEEAYKAGMRHLQPLHEKDDIVSPVGDVYTAPAPHLGGLTPFGADVIRECNRIGMLVDLAHGTTDTVQGALRVATQPFLISHTDLNRRDPNTSADIQRRLLDLDTARAVAQAGGVIGIWWRQATTLQEYAATLKAAAGDLGIDHVGIGTDTDMTASYILPYTNRIFPDQTAGLFYALTAELLKLGMKPEDISKIGGGNFCRIFAKVVG